MFEIDMAMKRPVRMLNAKVLRARKLHIYRAYLGFGLCIALNVGNVIFGPYSHSADWRPGCGSVAAVFKRDTRWASSSELQFLRLEAGGYIPNAFHSRYPLPDCSETGINVKLRLH
ncbi:hypothetical protein L2E82_11407 [Cichorium intybus]|uniref:Uncharacterized protein n=1 Tax=Cichorium intybus TaxID=13427 RepID=A0ACB9GDX7_CICIN|nr:hypothetical protein L2E82_11407 [Cichorium intybus]